MFFLLGFSSIVPCSQGVMILGGEVFHGALHWSIPYHLDGGWARLEERTPSLMLDNAGFRDGVHLNSGPWIGFCCLKWCILPILLGFGLGAIGTYF